MVRVGGPGIIVRRNLLCSIYNFGLLTITTTFWSDCLDRRARGRLLHRGITRLLTNVFSMKLL